MSFYDWQRRQRVPSEWEIRGNFGLYIKMLQKLSDDELAKEMALIDWEEPVAMVSRYKMEKTERYERGMLEHAYPLTVIINTKDERLIKTALDFDPQIRKTYLDGGKINLPDDPLRQAIYDLARNGFPKLMERVMLEKNDHSWDRLISDSWSDHRGIFQALCSGDNDKEIVKETVLRYWNVRNKELANVFIGKNASQEAQRTMVSMVEDDLRQCLLYAAQNGSHDVCEAIVELGAIPGEVTLYKSLLKYNFESFEYLRDVFEGKIGLSKSDNAIMDTNGGSSLSDLMREVQKKAPKTSDEATKKEMAAMERGRGREDFKSLGVSLGEHISWDIKRAVEDAKENGPGKSINETGFKAIKKDLTDFCVKLLQKGVPGKDSRLETDEFISAICTQSFHLGKAWEDEIVSREKPHPEETAIQAFHKNPSRLRKRLDKALKTWKSEDKKDFMEKMINYGVEIGVDESKFKELLLFLIKDYPSVLNKSLFELSKAAGLNEADIAVLEGSMMEGDTKQSNMSIPKKRI